MTFIYSFFTPVVLVRWGCEGRVAYIVGVRASQKVKNRCFMSCVMDECLIFTSESLTLHYKLLRVNNDPIGH